MNLNSGETVFLRLLPDMQQFSGTLVSVSEDSITVRVAPSSESKVGHNRYVVIIGDNINYYTEMLSMNKGILVLRRLWEEKRGYFRVDDVFPLTYKKISGKNDFKGPTVFSHFRLELPEIELPEDSGDIRMWKAILAINKKLDMILDTLHLQAEGLTREENKAVNVSASGIRFIVNDVIETGDNLEIKMLLPTLSVIHTWGPVVAVKDNGDGTREVSVQFHDLDDDMKDEIIQYTLKHQREMIRKRKMKELDT